MFADDLTYDDIHRRNEDHVGEVVYFKGEVVQYTEDPDAPFVVLVHVGQRSGIYIDDSIGLQYEGDPLMEYDIVEFVGTVEPLITYDSVFGSKTIPGLTVKVLRVVSTD